MANILVVYYYEQSPARATHMDYLYALGRWSDHKVSYLNIRVHDISRRIAEFPWDLILFHGIFFSRWNRQLMASITEKSQPLRDHPAVKAAMAQDEFLSMDMVCQFIRDFGVQHMFSVSPPSEWPKIYRDLPPSVQIHKVLTGYIDTRLQYRLDSMGNGRPIDIGYRTHRSPYWLGRHGQLKTQLGIAFAQAAKGLKTDISVEAKDTIFGDKWFEFLLSCKYQLGVEGGASILDWDGSYKDRTAEYLKSHRGASFEEVEKACFPGVDGSLRLFALSPRHFECAMTRTCQVLVEGEYDGVFKPWDHYIPVKRDLSNISEVLNLVRDDRLRKDIVERTWEEIVAPGQYTYQKCTEQILEAALPNVGQKPLPLYGQLKLMDAYATKVIWAVAARKRWSAKMKWKPIARQLVKAPRTLVPSPVKRLYRKAKPRPYYAVPLDQKLHLVDPNLISLCANNGAEFPLNMEGQVVGGDWDANRFLFSSLDTYQAIMARTQGVPWEKTAYYERVMRQMAAGEVMWSCSTREEFDARCAKWDELMEDMKINGYKTNIRKPHDEVCANVGRDGQLLFNNGRHRLAIAQILGLREIPIRLTVRHPDWVAFKQEILHYAATHNGHVYAPLLHPDLEDIPYQHTHERYDIIASSMSPYYKTLLDIGAHWGYFCIRFAREDMDCTAVEYGALNTKIMRGMKAATGTEFSIVNSSIFDVQPLKYDVVLALSIFHHFLLKQEKFQGFMDILHRVECKEMFVETHNPKENQMQDAYMKLEPSELADLISRESSLKHHKMIGETEDTAGTVRPIYRFWR